MLSSLEPFTLGSFTAWAAANARCLVERPIIFCFAHYHVHVAGIVIDQHLPQRREIGDGGRVGLPCLRRQQHHRLAGFKPAPSLVATPARSSQLRTAELNPFGMVPSPLELRLEEHDRRSGA